MDKRSYRFAGREAFSGGREIPLVRDGRPGGLLAYGLNRLRRFRGVASLTREDR